MVILQSLNNVVLRLFGGEVFWDEGLQPFGLEADFLLLVGLLLAHDGENDVGIEPAILGELLHLQCLRQRRGGLLGIDGIQQTVLFSFGQVGKLHSGSESDFPGIHQVKQRLDKMSESDVTLNLPPTIALRSSNGFCAVQLLDHWS